MGSGGGGAALTGKSAAKLEEVVAYVRANWGFHEQLRQRQRRPNLGHEGVETAHDAASRSAVSFAFLRVCASARTASKISAQDGQISRSRSWWCQVRMPSQEIASQSGGQVRVQVFQG